MFPLPSRPGAARLGLPARGCPPGAPSLIADSQVRRPGLWTPAPPGPQSFLLLTLKGHSLRAQGQEPGDATPGSVAGRQSNLTNMSSRAPRPSWVHLPPLADPPAYLLDWLCERFPRIPRSVWQRRMAEGLVSTADGQTLSSDAPFVAHQRVAYFREVEGEPTATQEIDIIHLDDHLVVADKPPFMPVTPGGRFVKGCLLYRLEAQLGLEGLSPIHRLDRGTSGLVMLSRSAEVRSVYGGLFARNTLERVYEAVAAVAEPPEERSWRVESRIVPGTPFFRMQEVAGTSNAFTVITLQDWHGGWGRFELRPESGKTHQLRLHMASLGWPIWGDRLYPQLLPETADDLTQPLALVARRLSFDDPMGGRHRVFESRLRPASPA